ncbi:hypothetical protein ACOKGD_10645 [Microbacterium phosphatis]|uniref:hypothetical protein n=1 Tax=Microbacterium phosphatis TaxID=3140248 RepID=UPI0031403A6D
MDSQKFVRDLGAEVGAPSPAALAAARAQLMAEFEREAAERRPVAIATRSPKRRAAKDPGGLAPVTALEPRASRGRKAARVALAVAAVAVVVAAAIGGVQLLSGLRAEDRTAGPVDPAFAADGTYLKVTQTRESVWTWSDATRQAGYGWGDGPWPQKTGEDPWGEATAATSAFVLESTATVERPRDLSDRAFEAEEGTPTDAPWRVTQGEPCTVAYTAGAPSDEGAAAASQRCATEIGAAGDSHGDVEGTSEPVWGTGRAASWCALGSTFLMWDQYPRDPEALRAHLGPVGMTRADAPYTQTVASNAVRELSWNALPEDLRGAYLEVLAAEPRAEVERKDGQIVRIDLTERVQDDLYEQRYVVTQDPDLGTVDTVTTLRSLSWEPRGIGLDLPDGGAWGARITTTAIPIDPPAQPTPAPTDPPVEPTADLSTWRITEEGIGPFTIGMPWADAVARATDLGGDATAAGEAGSCGVVWVTQGEVMVAAHTSDGATVTAVRTEYTGPDGPTTQAPSTTDGITLHSTVDEVRAIHADARETSDELVGAFLTVAGAQNRIHFGYATEDGGDITTAGDVFAIEVNTLDVLPYEHCDGGDAGGGDDGTAAPDPQG